MVGKPEGPALTHEELAALDFVIMRAVQRGAKPNDALSFIESIAATFTDTIPNVTPVIFAVPMPVADHVQLLAVAQEIADATGGAAARLPGPHLDAVKQAIHAVGSAPSLTLQQLIEIRRNAVQAQRKP
jgi:hypothetical protein